MDNVNTGNLAERYCTLTIGVLFLVLGIVGFIPALVSIPGTAISYVPPEAAHDAYALGFGYILGLFPTNFLHNIVHCAVGLWGIASYLNSISARNFNRAFAVAYALIAIMGVLPIAKTTFGLMPIFGNNVWINALSAFAAAYYGLIIPAKLKDVNVTDNLS